MTVCIILEYGSYSFRKRFTRLRDSACTLPSSVIHVGLIGLSSRPKFFHEFYRFLSQLVQVHFPST